MGFVRRCNGRGSIPDITIPQLILITIIYMLTSRDYMAWQV